MGGGGGSCCYPDKFLQGHRAMPGLSNCYHQPLLTHLSYYESFHKATSITQFDSLTNPKVALDPSSDSVHTHFPSRIH